MYTESELWPFCVVVAGCLLERFYVCCSNGAVCGTAFGTGVPSGPRLAQSSQAKLQACCTHTVGIDGHTWKTSLVNGGPGGI